MQNIFYVNFVNCILRNIPWVWISMFQLIGFGIARYIQKDMNWYSDIIKSSLTPPSNVFGIAWGILYTILAIIGHFLWKNRNDDDMLHVSVLYMIQMILNWAWSPIFFNQHLIGMGFIIILSMILMNAVIFIKLYKKEHKCIAYLIVPYLLWLLFAGYLNLIILMCN